MHSVFQSFFLRYGSTLIFYFCSRFIFSSKIRKKEILLQRQIQPPYSAPSADRCMLSVNYLKSLLQRIAGQLNDTGDSVFSYTTAVTAPHNLSLIIVWFYLNRYISITHVLLPLSSLEIKDMDGYRLFCYMKSPYVFTSYGTFTFFL